MEYHKDRFVDFSLMVYKGDRLIALFPANILEEKLYSHQGLTFGGVLLPKGIGFYKVEAIFHSILDYCKSEGIKSMFVKSIPEIYFDEPANELNYLLFRNNARLYRKDKVLAIDYSQPLSLHKTKLKHYRKADSLGFEIKEELNFDVFWEKVLQPRLVEKHSAKPVHTKEEINHLATCFPENIKQFNIYLNGEILAGITVFENETIVKSQYGATTHKGELVRALDYLFITLIKKYEKEGKRFFSMGTVVDNNDKGYNPGLLKQKEEFGCNIYLQDFYEIRL